MAICGIQDLQDMWSHRKVFWCHLLYRWSFTFTLSASVFLACSFLLLSPSLSGIFSSARYAHHSNLRLPFTSRYLKEYIVLTLRVANDPAVTCCSVTGRAEAKLCAAAHLCLCASHRSGSLADNPISLAYLSETDLFSSCPFSQSCIFNIVSVLIPTDLKIVACTDQFCFRRRQIVFEVHFRHISGQGCAPKRLLYFIALKF